MSKEQEDSHELKQNTVAQIEAPDLPYQPPTPKLPVAPIALIGCGGIASNHLQAYQEKNYPVTVLCDINLEAAKKLRDTHFPQADISDDPDAVLARTDIEVVDIATHPDHRTDCIRKALIAGKHVLSQKPFVTNLDVGRQLVELAESRNLKLAVNQNGRWAPYFAYLLQLIERDILGDISSCDVHIAWDHSWIKGTKFEQIHHIMLYDFAIHWFDMVTCVFGDKKPLQVFSQVQQTPGQSIKPPLSAQSMIKFESGMASLVFHGHTPFSPAETTVVTGTKGTFRSTGPVCANTEITLTTEEGEATPPLEGNWFNDGFAGTMGELLCAIEENREPNNSARNNLRSLELCFSAIASADQGIPITPDDLETLEIDPNKKSS